jgi:hypothetical protein
MLFREAEMLGVVFTLPVLLVAASAMAESPKVDQPPVSSGSSMPRAAIPEVDALVAIAPAPLTDDEQRQEDARRRALLMLLLNSTGRVQPFSGMSR